MVKNKPLVSVVIPTYNRADIIKRSIDSVLEQTYKNIEIVIVDDGSTDNTKEVVESYDDQRVRYVSYGTNRGANHARNTGIKKAKGTLIAFQDSDDVWHPEKIEKQVKAYLESPDDHKVVYTGTRSRRVEGFYMPEDWVKPKEGYVFKPSLRGTFANMVTILTEKECLEKIGYFDEELPRLQDWDLGIRLSKKYKFKFIDEPLVDTYSGADSITSSHNSLAEALEIILKKHRHDLIREKDIFSCHHFWLASTYISLGRWEKGIENIKKGQELKPLSPITALRLFSSLLGTNFYKKFRGLHRRIFV